MDGTPDPVADDAGAPDAGASDQFEDQLRISEERHRLLADNANDVIWTMSLDGQITYVSPAVERMRGFTQAEAMSQPIEEIHPPASQAVSLAYFQRLFAALAEGRPAEEFRGELEYFCKDGSTVWTDVQVIPHLSETGELVEILGVTRDISQRKQYENEIHEAKAAAESANAALKAANEELRLLSITDALTGTWNRRHFEYVAEVEIAKARRYGQPLSLQILDVDDFKAINDELGHQSGDQVLVELTGRIQRNLRDTDVLVRWGGEELLVMMPHCALDSAVQLAEKLRGLVASTPFLQGRPVTISVGVAEFRSDESFDDWLRRADAALYLAKSGGRNAVWVASGRGGGVPAAELV